MESTSCFPLLLFQTKLEFGALIKTLISGKIIRSKVEYTKNIYTHTYTGVGVGEMLD